MAASESLPEFILALEAELLRRDYKTVAESLPDFDGLSEESQKFVLAFEAELVRLGYNERIIRDNVAMMVDVHKIAPPSRSILVKRKDVSW